MEALIELCDLIAQNPKQFSEKLDWICSRCPPPGSLLSRSPKVTRSHLNAVLAITKFLSKCPKHTDLRPTSLIIEFLQSIPASFRQSFWSQSFGIESTSSFYYDFLGYIVKETDLSSDLTEEVSEFMGWIVISGATTTTTIASDDGAGICRVFLTCVSHYCPPLLFEDAEKLVYCLLDQFVVVTPTSPRERGSLASSMPSSPYNGNQFQYRPTDSSSPVNVKVVDDQNQTLD